MNNKGQTLVLFVMILPIALLLIYFVYTRIMLYGEKKQEEDIANSICRYYHDGKSINELEEIIKANDKDYSYKIKEENNTIKIIISKEIDSLLNKKDKVKTELICE